MTQLDLFEFYEEQEIQAEITGMDYLEEVTTVDELSIGDTVRIRTVDELDQPDIETVAYLSGYKYGGKEGKITDIHRGSSAVSYYVETKIGIACLHAEELAFIS